VVKRFGDPIYPALTSVGLLRKGPIEKAHHAVINGENFHALQLITYLYERQVDCIYIDPPYNTGARDWKYNVKDFILRAPRAITPLTCFGVVAEHAG
jgi:adenine-specific DNA-methyltransferase